MSDPDRRQRRPPANIVLGITRLARGRADGFDQFGVSRDAFLASLAPLVAFPLVGGLLTLAQGDVVGALVDLLATLCALLAPPVLSYEFARLWKREGLWLRFAVAFNWCQWAIPITAALLLMGFGALTTMGLSVQFAGGGVLLGVVAYGLWMHWFLARRGLVLSAGRAALLVLAVNFGTVVLVLGPRLLAMVAGAGHVVGS